MKPYVANEQESGDPMAPGKDIGPSPGIAIPREDRYTVQET